MLERGVRELRATRTSTATACSRASTSTSSCASAKAAERGQLIYSGGIGSWPTSRHLAEPRAEAQLDASTGVIVGKALYERRFTIEEAPRRSPARPRTDRRSRSDRGRYGGQVHFKRVIPCLDVDAGRVVKGVEFVDIRDAGDPVELAAHYDREGADELVFLDITATHEKRDTIAELARRTADDVFVPFTIGGGIRSVADAQAVLDAGADKVSVNSAALAAPRADRRAGRRCSARSASCSRSTPRLLGAG